jgi:DNA-binding IscR family transcriptional regulator
VDGGYYLARPPEEISLHDIIESFDNPLSPEMPSLEGLSTAVENRILATLQSASAAAHHELAKLTVAELMNTHSE